VSGFEQTTFAIVGGHVVVAPGQSIDGGTLVLREGMIVAVGKDIAVPTDAEVIDAKGLVVHAGFIDAATGDLLDPDRKPKHASGRQFDFTRYVLAATRPDNRLHITPEFVARGALKFDTAKLETARKAGFTSLHVLPSGRVASGQGAFVSVSGAPIRESLLRDATFSEFQLFPPRGSAYPATLMGATAHLRQAFLDARRHALRWELYDNKTNGVTRPPIDETYSAMNDVLTGKQRAVFLADTRDDIYRALEFSESHKLKPVLWGVKEAYRAADRLEQTKIDLVMAVDFGAEPKVRAPKSDGKLTADDLVPVRVQQDRLDQWRKRVAGLAELNRRKIRFAITSRGLKSATEIVGNLRQAIRAGLPRDAALAAVTTNAATILGIDDRLGSLTPGKLAHVVVRTGPFDHEQAKVRYVFVGGRKFEYNSDAKPVPAPKEKQPPAVDLAGKWKLVIEASTGKLPATLQFAQSGTKLTGSFTSKQGNGRVASGSIKEAVATFTIEIGAGAQTIRLAFSGKLEKGKLAGELKSAFGAATKWSAVRETPKKASKPKNPVQITLSTDDKPKTSTVAIPKNEQPTELESDRLKRPFRTGGNVLIRNATVLTATGKTLPATSILVRQGKIVAIGKDLKPDKGMRVVDASGRFVMPGIIDTHSHIMISGGVNESTLSIVPEVSIRDVVNTVDTSEYRALAGGVTTARLLHGSANVIGGQDAVVKLKYGMTAKNHILHDAPQGVKFALGENVKFTRTRFPNTRLGVEATLNRAFFESIDYRRQWQEYNKRLAAQKDKADGLLPPRRDLRLEALADIVNHQKFIHAHCYRADEILMLLRVASNLGIRIWSLQHVLEGYKIAPEIVEHGASCSTFSDWWAYKVEAFDATPYNAALLKEAGANIVIKSDDRELIRHLYLEAAKTVRYGNMSPDHALQTITLNSARELSLHDRIGSIEVGKDADLAIFSGHPLNAFSRCEMTFIEGELYFSREHVPTAMSTDASQRSAKPRSLVFPSDAIRTGLLDLDASANGHYAITNAVLHPISGPDIAIGTLLVENGKIVALGAKVKVPSGTKAIDAKGLHVYPGMIDAGTTLGLVEIRRVLETHDYAEGGGLQPDLRAGIALNRDSELIPVARAGGITTILVRPTGGTIAGQASLARLAGWTAEKMILDYTAGLQINWPSNSKPLEEFLKEAREYNRLRMKAEKAKQRGPITDPRFEAMRPYLAGQKPIFIEANSRKQIAGALLFAEKQKLKIVITGGHDAWKLASELKKRNVPVIVGPVMRRPTENDPFDAPYANPGRLYEAGVKFCIRSNSASNSRNAPFEAAMAVAYGLPEAEAVKAVTLSAAEILGLADRMGSLTVGKQANLVIADGSILQHTAQIKGVFIDGKPYRPESRQTRFYEEYRRRLHEVKNGRVADGGKKEKK
jgi:imidazolonepropionase-like amidohydrolase